MGIKGRWKPSRQANDSININSPLVTYFFFCSVSVWSISRYFYFAGLKEFHEECLSAHNEYRIRHGAAPLHWSAELAWEAQQWAENLAQTGELRHNEDDTVGENLAGMVGGELSGREAVDMWYEEIESYDFESPGYSEDTSNFTQVRIIHDVFMTYSWVWFIFDTQYSATLTCQG